MAVAWTPRRPPRSLLGRHARHEDVAAVGGDDPRVVDLGLPADCRAAESIGPEKSRRPRPTRARGRTAGSQRVARHEEGPVRVGFAHRVGVALQEAAPGSPSRSTNVYGGVSPPPGGLGGFLAIASEEQNSPIATAMTIHRPIRFAFLNMILTPWFRSVRGTIESRLSRRADRASRASGSGR